MAGDLARELADLKEEEALNITRARLDAGEDPLGILNDARQGLEIVGQRFADKEYFIPELIFSGEILREITELVKPKLTEHSNVKAHGTVVLGTVAGDLHDIGKNIVNFMLDISGFEVCDLGVDVPAEKFVDKIKETGTGVVALSGFLTLAFDSMKETIEVIEAAGLRDNVKIMIGGGQVDEHVKKYTGADGYGADAAEAVSLARKWLGV